MSGSDSGSAGGTGDWFVLYTMPQHEKKVAEHLSRHELEYYLPMVPRKRQWSDRIKMIDFPLFPGYIFVRLDWATQHLLALQHSGSLAFVRHKDRPATISSAELENLRQFVAASGDPEALPDDSFPEGAEVLLRFGPLKGVRGVVQRVGKKGRVFVRVPFLNQMVSAEVDVFDLEPT